MDELNQNETTPEEAPVQGEVSPREENTGTAATEPVQKSGSDIIDMIDSIDTEKMQNSAPTSPNREAHDPFSEKNYNMGMFHEPQSRPYDRRGHYPNQNGYAPNGYNPNRNNYDPNRYDPNQNGYNPNGYIPNQNGYNSNGYIPNRNGYNPNSYNPYSYTPNYPPAGAPMPVGGNAAAKKKRLSNGGLAAIIISISAMFILIIIVLAFSTVGETYEEDTAPANSPVVSSESGVTVDIPIQSKPTLESKYYEDEETGLLTVAGVAKRVSPSVVDVMVYRDTSLYPYSTGSGIIISEDGYIVTNAHVVSEVDAGLKVILDSGEEYKAEIIGQDSRTDIAVLKIEAEDLIAADLGDSDQLELGEMVVAIGNAGGYSGTLTVGYVSGLNREVKTSTDGDTMTCIQTDAAMSPGVSGGALINMYGQVVGITSSKYKSTALDEGIGFAITTQFAKPIIEDIISRGYISGRVRIGITYTLLTDDVAEAYGVKRGILIQSVDESCDVANTDLQKGDIMTELNGQELYSTQTIKAAIEGCEPGDVISAHIFRKGVTEDEDTEFDITFELMQDTTLS